MAIIQKLDKDVAQKIAAGEVVERPGSVVKELVENSLDAHATDIQVDLLDGGKGEIRVTDNGDGMSPEDALLCFESHATSKICNAEDLENIATLGFRGEALSSIAAVARITLKTSDGISDRGTQVRIEGQGNYSQTEIAFPKGTGLTIQGLFFNLPARKKFLRSARAELNRITRFMTDISMAHPGVRFALSHEKRKVFDYPAVAGLKERLFQIFGKAFLESLLNFDYRDKDLRFFGFVSRPPSARMDRKRQFFFINGRLVKDPTIQAAVNQAFRNFLEKDQSAEAVVFLELPYNQVDVNVHPAKSEVRFQDSRLIFSFVYRCVEQALLKELGIKEVYPEIREQNVPADSRVQEMSQPPLMKYPDTGSVPSPAVPRFASAPKSRSPRVLGQYLDFYIVAEDEEGLLIIDQHNAHERVLFDKYLEIDREKTWPRKLALDPRLVDLSPAQVMSLEENRDLMQETGFAVDAMGGQSYAIKEFPDIFTEKEAEDVFLTLLEDVGKEKLDKKRHRALATMACKSAIKAGEPLAPEKMAYLVEELFKTSNTALCPHGRPVTLRLRRGEIEKALRRN
jgi:DNA mismatch repair protein MutL